MDAVEGLWTVRKLLDWTAKFFEKQGIDSNRLDAEVLLAHSLGVERLSLYLDMDRPLSERERAPLRELVTRRGKREPVAYLTGSKEFYSLSFEVSPAVLIPRPETELLVDAALERFAEDEQFSFVDVGTGSGCIAVAIAANRKSAKGLAVDACEDALRVASSNIARHGLSDRIASAKSDFLEQAAGMLGENSVDIVVTNPPYVTWEEFESLQPEITVHEPRIALVDDAQDGLDSFRKIAASATKVLRPGGFLVCELGAGRYAAASEFLESAGNWKNIESVRDFGGILRVIIATRSQE